MNHERPSVGDRITRSRLPVNGSLQQRDNAPLSAGFLLGGLASVMAATQGSPLWFVLAVFVVIVAVMVIVQIFVVPAADLLESSGPVRQHPRWGVRAPGPAVKVDGGCPRRGEGPAGAYPGTDTWRREGKVGDVGVHTCSFCGSLRPADFLDLWAPGATVGPTDKSYKLYMDAAAPAVRGAGKLYTMHLTSADDQARFMVLADDALGQPAPDFGALGPGAARGREDGPKTGFPGYFYSKVHLPPVAS